MVPAMHLPVHTPVFIVKDSVCLLARELCLHDGIFDVFIRDRTMVFPHIRYNDSSIIMIPHFAVFFKLFRFSVPAFPHLKLLIRRIFLALRVQHGVFMLLKSLKPLGNAIPQCLPVPFPLSVVPQEPGAGLLLFAVGLDLFLGAWIVGGRVFLKGRNPAFLSPAHERTAIVPVIHS